MKTTTLSLRNSIGRLPLRAFLLIPFVLVCFALSPQARAVCQEGCLTDFNTVLGEDALLNNTGSNNTAIGFEALLNNTTGSANTATGVYALFYNTAGTNNMANGFKALLSNTNGNKNTASGVDALLNNTTGNANTAVGYDALFYNTTGSSNIALGYRAGSNLTSGNNNIALGRFAGSNLSSGDNNIDIGNYGVASESGKIRIGTDGTQTATYIAGISGATVPTGVGVIIDGSGHLGTTRSSARFKEAIRSMDNASEAILALRPVTFCYKHDLDPEGVPQFGLVAEEVEKVNPDLVARDADGKAYTVRYEAVNAMLLNEFLKEHRNVEEQGAMITKQQKQIEALTAAVQKVSAQLELSKPVMQPVANNQ